MMFFIDDVYLNLITMLIMIIMMFKFKNVCKHLMIPIDIFDHADVNFRQMKFNNDLNDYYYQLIRNDHY